MHRPLLSPTLPAGLKSNDSGSGGGETKIKLAPVKASKRISSLISKCCRFAPSERPEIGPIKRKLHSVINNLTGGGSAPPASESVATDKEPPLDADHLDVDDDIEEADEQDELLTATTRKLREEEERDIV